MAIHITGRVLESETGRPVAGIPVEVYDADIWSDDLLGRTQTDEDGRYRVETKARLGVFRERPDPYVLLKDGRGRTLKSTRSSHLQDITGDVVIDVPISCYKLVEAGLLEPDQLPPELREPSDLAALSRWSFPPPEADAVFAAIEKDRASQASLLELLADYMRSLRTSTDNQAPAFAKMAKLFSLGLTPKEVEGHHCGVCLGLRLTEKRHALSRLDNVIELLWGATLEEESPWVGKSFERLDPARAQGLTGEKPDPARPAFLGINHFNRLDWRPANLVSYHALSYWLQLHDATAAERATYAYDRKGGNFVAGQAPSVCGETPREVFSLNYRWPSMHNRPPLAWLIDELVQIGDGLYLGQLLFATRKLLGTYDPGRPATDYAYNHMGYFALWDAKWNAEARRLFAFLEIPVTAPGLVRPERIEVGTAETWRTLQCESPAPAICDDTVFAEVESDLRGRESVLHLCKAYSDELMDKLDNNSPYFRRLQELFNRGAPVREMKGFFRGALISWHSAGLLELFKHNALDKLQWYAARYSTWTGKRFDPISAPRLAEITDGYEQGTLPTAWGANTQALRTLREKEVGKLMELANMWSEPAAPEEAERFGYDLKNIFFIGHAGESLNPGNRGKRVYQFNYRWPKLRTIVPDCYCIDEIVEIAQGLFLGQLMYATDWSKPYDPRLPPAEYKYGQFGYFLLMTEPWHQIRLRIGFDLDNV
jgi:hypothetical protein